jgi:hypothetical protein
MGASGWEYRVPFKGRVRESFKEVREQLLASGDYIWPWDDVAPDEGNPEDVFLRPTSLPQLATAKEAEEFWEEGTHSILDMAGVSESDDPDQFGVVRAVSAEELTQVFGTVLPTVEDFDHVYQPGPSGALGDLMGAKWSGRSLILYRDESPSEVYFWGVSGD